MTDQPQGPQQPPEEPPAAASGPPAPQPPAGPPPPGPPPQAPAYGAPPQAPGYGAPPQQYGAPQPQQPAYPPPAANPYGGYSAAPVYAGGRPTYPGSIGYVEQYFGRVATFGQRALALIIDTLLAMIGLIPMVIGFVVLIAAAPTTTGAVDEFGRPVMAGGDGDQAAVGITLIVVGGLISLGITLWNRVFRMGRTGQSVGKSAMSLKLIDDKTGQPIGAGMCFLREIVAGLANQIFYLSWLWMLWDTDKQTLADKAVHSTVVVLQT